MTTPKSPDTIIKEFEEMLPKIDVGSIKDMGFGRTMTVDLVNATHTGFYTDFLRSSMSSLLCYMAERIEKEKTLRRADAVERKFSMEECDGWHAAIDDCRTLLIKEARKISEV